MLIDLIRKVNGDLKHLNIKLDSTDNAKRIKANSKFRKQKDGTYNFPLDWRMVELLKEMFNAKLTKEAHKWFSKIQDKKEVIQNIYSQKEISQQDNFLYPYQTVDVEMMKQMKRVINGNDMGLGKTVEVISLLKEIKAKKTLIVCPASLKYNWGQEIDKFSNFSYVTTDYTGYKYKEKRKQELQQDVDIYIVNYEMLNKKTYPELFSKYDIVVVDEAHALKNAQTKISKSVRMLKSDYLVLLTGTAMTNSQEDLWGLLNLLDPKNFTNKYNFIDDFCVTSFNPFGRAPLIVGNKNVEELRNILIMYMFRREKENTLDLPDKIYQTIRVNMNNKQRKIYDELETQSWTELENGDVFKADTAISQILRLRQVALNPSIIGGEDISAKTEALLDIMEDVNNQVVIFSWFKSYVNLLKEKLEDKGYSVSFMTGDTKQKDRHQAIDDFKKGKNKIFLATIATAGVGLNLQNADTVIFMDKPYTPHLVKQAEDRVYRNGQKNTVHIISLVANNSIDEDIEIVLEQKQDTINEIIIVRELVERMVERIKIHKEE